MPNHLSSGGSGAALVISGPPATIERGCVTLSPVHDCLEGSGTSLWIGLEFQIL